MSQKILCPYCFTSFKNTDALCQCTNNEVNSATGEPYCPKEPDKALSDYRREGGLVSKHLYKARVPLFSGIPAPTKCDRCGAVSSRFVCPHCHNALPQEMIEEGAEIISIIGAPSSGKTVYFVALINALESCGFRLGLSVRPKDEVPGGMSMPGGGETTAKIYGRLKDDLFGEGYLPNQTARSERSLPLIFRLTSSVEAFKYNKNDKSIYLVFYDTAGESFTDPESIANNVKYLKESSGIILLLDPFSVPELRKMLEKAGIQMEENRGDVREVLTQLLGIADNKVNLRKKPIAVTFSKIDSVVNGLEQAGEDRIQGIDLRMDSSFLRSGVFSPMEVQQNSDALFTYCVDKWRLGQVLQDVGASFANYKLFGVSSLGGSPDEDNPNHITDIKPYRVLDPLVWILTQMNGFHIPVEK